MAEAAWFPDPEDGSRLRWWDGARWTEHTAPMPPAEPAQQYVQPQQYAQPQQFPQPYHQQQPMGALGGPVQANAQSDLESERRGGRRAAIALLAGLACYPAYDTLLLLTLRDLVPWMKDAFSVIGDATEAEAPVLPAMPRSLQVLDSFAQLASFGLLAIQIIFVIWVYRAAVLARRAGLPAAHSPAWTVAGFFVPIINFWFPYQGLRDLFPAGHAARRTVQLWYVAYLGQIVLLGLSVGAAFASFPVAAVLVVAAVVAGVAQMLLGRSVIAQSLAAHTELLGLGRTPDQAPGQTFN